MATYCIGDVHGCLFKLQELLKLINFTPNSDTLWFVGDLVNRGTNSLEVLRLVNSLPNKIVVLGNHDLHLLNFYSNNVDFETTHLEPILAAEDAPELINWLRHSPLMHYDAKFNAVLVHAGIYPEWNLTQAQNFALEVEQVLRGENYVEFLRNMYGDKPNIWNDNLTGYDRLRFIVNAFTRMRFCYADGSLDFNCTGKINSAPKGLIPWFSLPSRKKVGAKIFFGHWAALEGITNTPNIFALDTGCVYGKSLTAIRIEDEAVFKV